MYGTEGISPSIVATSYKGTMPKIITDNMQDKQVTTCAIRGRGESGNLHQSLEQGGDVANAVTTSHKDSMVMEIGNIYPATGNPQAGRIYDEQGISPALDTMEGGNRQPKILTPRRTEYGKQVRKDYEKGNLQESRHNMTELTPREDDCSNTLTSVQKDNLLLITEEEGRQQALGEVRSNVKGKRDGKATAVLEEDGTIRGVHYPNGKDSSLSEHIVQHENNPSMTVITANQPKVYGKSTKYRIRRLTERECFRLMNLDEKDIDTIQSAGISCTQQYKMAGNSIVVACLYHLFRKLFTQPGNEEQQLSLF